MTKKEYLKFLDDLEVSKSKIAEYDELEYNYIISITYITYSDTIFRISKFDKSWNLVRSFTKLKCSIFWDLDWEDPTITGCYYCGRPSFSPENRKENIIKYIKRYYEQ